eukprot:tig00001206_g7491.t2
MRFAAPSPTEAALRVLRAPSPGFRMDLHAPRSGRPPNPSAIRTDCDGPGTPASIRRDAMRLHLSHLRERGRPGTGLPVRGSLGFRPPRAAFLSLSGQSVAGTGEPPGTARTFDLLILST